MKTRTLAVPAALAAAMKRLYERGLTTLSGGNLSVRGEDGSLWITPAGVDKGRLEAGDIVRVAPDGAARGAHAPSSEWPFHRAIYAAAPEVGAIVHAHPRGLLAFSTLGRAPDARVFGAAAAVCGRIGFAPYALTGSETLGAGLAAAVANGHTALIMQNHGGLAVGASLAEAMTRFEMLEFCARVHLLAAPLGGARVPAAAQTPAASVREDLEAPGAEDRALVETLRRARDRHLLVGGCGAVSTRTASGFAIAPHPAASADYALHAAAYAADPDVGAAITAHPPHLMAYAVSGAPFLSRAIAETYMVMRDLARLPYGAAPGDPAGVARLLREGASVVMIDNTAILATGTNLLQAYDRLEVAENSAAALLAAARAGAIQPISDARIAELKAALER